MFSDAQAKFFSLFITLLIGVNQMKTILKITAMMMVTLVNSSTAFAVLYFGYGSNLSPKFMNERLKPTDDWQGSDEDGWYKNGPAIVNPPKVKGCYVLNDFEFHYNLKQDGEVTTSGNVMRAERKKVYGVVYDVQNEHFTELDRSENYHEGEPQISSYTRELLDVYPCPDLDTMEKNDFVSKEPVSNSIKAWVYIGVDRPGNLEKDPTKYNPGKFYVDLLIAGAKKQKNIPQSYIQNVLNWKSLIDLSKDPTLANRYY